MWVLINEYNNFFSVTGDWVRLNNWKDIKIFDQWITIESKRVRLEGDGVSGPLKTVSLGELLDNFFRNLHPIIEDLHSLMSVRSSKEIAKVGGSIEMKALLVDQRNEINKLKRKIGMLNKKIRDYETD